MTSEFSGIYQIRNNIDGKVYVGRSKRVKSRWSAHKTALRRGSHWNPPLQAAWLKFGESAFTFEIIERIDDSALLPSKEAFYCTQMGVFDRKLGYNLEQIDVAGAITSMPEESRLKMSKAKTGKPGPWAGKKRVFSPEHRAKIVAAGKARKGIPRSDETKAKMSVARKGTHPSEATRKKISAVQVGKTISEETRRRMSESHKIRLSDPEARKYLSRPHSEETRQKRSDSMKRYLASKKEVSVCRF